jgi:hypothetical protein
MRPDVAPPGRVMTFPEWSRAIVDGVRAFLPNATAERKGRRLVLIRHGDHAALLANDASFWVTFTAGDMNIKKTMCSFVDDRRDEFTAANLAHSIAGYFDARFTRGSEASLGWVERGGQRVPPLQADLGGSASISHAAFRTVAKLGSLRVGSGGQKLTLFAALSN